MREQQQIVFMRKMRGKVQHFEEDKYWKYRERVIHYHGGFLEKIICTWYLYKIKKADAFNNASLGTHLGYGAKFGNMPTFPHGLYVEWTVV